MPLLEILDVSACDPNDCVESWYLDRPRPGATADLYAVEISGWVVGRNARVLAVEVVEDELLVRQTPTCIDRPDVTGQFPSALGAERPGFSTSVGMLGIPLEFELALQALLEGQSPVRFAVIRGRRRRLETTFQPQLQPLMLTFVGRTGSTWLMRLLGEHPEVVVHRAYPYETQAAGYWMHMLRVLTQPSDHAALDDRLTFAQSTAFVGHHPAYSADPETALELRGWFGAAHAEDLAAFCQRTIEGFYRHVAQAQGESETRYFAEKYTPGPLGWLNWELYPKAREVILIRDFRDVVCSILTFGASRADAVFGRGHYETDEDFIRDLRLSLERVLETWEKRHGLAHLVRYEDLVLRPAETLTHLFDYLAIDSAPATVEGMIRRATESSELEGHRTSHDGQSSIGRWRRELSPHLQAVTEEALGDILRAFGYASDEEPAQMSRA